MSAFDMFFRRFRHLLLTQDEWFDAVCRSYSNPPVFFNGQELPGFPPDIIQTNTTGQAGPATLREAFIFYQDCLNTFDRLGAPIQRDHRLLDFGVGWGRIARFFLRELPLNSIYGIDVTEDFVTICRETFKSDNFHLTMPFPPTSMPDGRLQYIVGYSVFSHLSEQACMRWMEEFHRLLAPGGIVALTTRGRPFFDLCESLRGQGHSGYLASLSMMFDDFDEARARYDSGAFVHSNADGVNGGGAMSAAFYGESFIPSAYAARAYSEWFSLEDFLFDPSRQTHPIMFFRRRQ